MGKILIVEDEYIERMELNNQMADEFGSDNILTASTCAQAIDLIKREIPDIVLLDIMLSGNSGFEVANYIKQKYPKVQIVIITAYNEFDFAYSAMNMGITDYLLKPVRPEIITEKIRKIMSSITKTAKPNTIIWPYLEENLVVPLKEILPIHPDVVGITSVPKGLSPEIESQLIDLLEEKTKAAGWIERKGNLIILYIKLETQHTVQNFFSTLYDACFRIGIGQIKFGVSVCPASCNKLPEAYWKAIDAYHSTIFFQSYNVVYSDTCKNSSSQLSSYPFEIEKHLIMNISNGTFDNCIDSIKSFVDYCIKNCSNDYHILESWVDNLKYAIIRYCTQHGINQDDIDTDINLTSPQNFYDSLYKIIQKITDETINKTTIRNPTIVKVLDIIKTRYNENLNLNLIAKKLFINPIYLSRLFKEQTGYNFKEYLTKVRFENARVMLEDGTKSISEISHYCGFNNPNYFSKAFKDCSGQTPTEFRQQLTERKI